MPPGSLGVFPGGTAGDTPGVPRRVPCGVPEHSFIHPGGSWEVFPGESRGGTLGGTLGGYPGVNPRGNGGYPGGAQGVMTCHASRGLLGCVSVAFQQKYRNTAKPPIGNLGGQGVALPEALSEGRADSLVANSFNNLQQQKTRFMDSKKSPAWHG